ncbi:MAG TPA: hypothetical protein VN541_11615, partial [Tepidisphaeraceae bacterium]|nr:hypothetical protein [Tepidisphaeraceae bacterium]
MSAKCHLTGRDVDLRELSRLANDVVTNMGGSTDQSIQRLGFSYNGLGLPFKETSYKDTAGTQIANQVEDLHNGYGQLTQQYQDHSKAVDPASSPQVQYAYSTGDNN